ncbi:MAG: dihydropteroate synthase [Chloroflexota bacterium]|nr:dihydropteroate synthase [Chloroflexota bacterium]
MDDTPSFRLPDGAENGLAQSPPVPLTVRGHTFRWGSRTHLMGIVNVTPDSFSGDGLLPAGRDRGEEEGPMVQAAVDQGRRMADEGADILDVGGESSRPGHAPVGTAEELRRVVPVVRALRAALPETPISIDTIKRDVAEAALDAGADMINDVWGVGSEADMARVAAERGVPYVLMHNRAEPRYANLMMEILAELQASLQRAIRLGVDPERIMIDPGFGFGKTPDHNLHLLAHLRDLRLLGRPILLGTSRKSTIGKVLDLTADERLEGTLATTALAAQAGVDMVRIHDVAPNQRTARMVDAITRPGAIGPDGWRPA